MVTSNAIDRLSRELAAAIAAVLDRYSTVDLPGMELHGELRGILQHRGHPETGNGFCLTLGNGVPDGWGSRNDGDVK
jgi:hypothetical protein